MFEIGSYLAKLRKLHGFTQANVADAIGVSNKTISKWERNEGMPDISVLVELAKLYNVSVDEILNGGNSDYKLTNDRLIKMVSEKTERNILIANLLLYVGLMLFFVVYFITERYYSILLYFIFVTIGLTIMSYEKKRTSLYNDLSVDEIGLDRYWIKIISLFLMTVVCVNYKIPYNMFTMLPDASELFSIDGQAYVYAYQTFEGYIKLLPVSLSVASIPVIAYALKISNIKNRISVRMLGLMVVVIVGLVIGVNSVYQYYESINYTKFNSFSEFVIFRNDYSKMREYVERNFDVMNPEYTDYSNVNNELIDPFIDNIPKYQKFLGITGFDQDKMLVYGLKPENPMKKYIALNNKLLYVIPITQICLLVALKKEVIKIWR